ncbi:MAG: hypothetical protein IKG14_01515 [Clostridia bacterium]|nr:hypothetical protein [Clostridia bacterium]
MNKSKKINLKETGITLVALVVTIIVLLILAGVTLTLALNNNGVLDRAQYASNTWANATKDETAMMGQMESDVDTLTAGFIEREDNPGGGSGGGSTGTALEWEIVTDNGAAGLTVGDVVRPTIAGVTTEQFYVIGIDGTENNQSVRLLARYCVNPLASVNKQNSEMGTLNSNNTYETFGALAFHSSQPYTNVYADSDTIKEKVEAYANWLSESLNLEDIEIAEGGNIVSGIKGRLMWGTYDYGEVQEVLAINTTGITGTTIVYGPEHARINYWLGTPNEYQYNYAYVVDSTGMTGAGGDLDNGVFYGEPVIWSECVDYCDYFGLRPVIKVLKSNF